MNNVKNDPGNFRVNFSDFIPENEQTLILLRGLKPEY